MKTEDQEIVVRIVDSLTFSLYLHLWETKDGVLEIQAMRGGASAICVLPMTSRRLKERV